MKKMIFRTIIFFISIIYLSSCAPEKLFGPTLTPIPIDTPTPTPVPIINDGIWSGKVNGSITLSFQVKNKEIISFTLQEFNTDQCFLTGLTADAEFSPVPIEDGKFEFTAESLSSKNNQDLLTGLGWAKIKVTGGFIDTQNAKGTISENDDCGSYEFSWTAKPH